MADQLEQTKTELIQSLNAVAQSMRSCASIAERFSQMVQHPGKRVKRKANDIEDTEVKVGRKRGARKPKDPDAPKRPASSYLLFQNEIRKEVKTQNPHLKASELLGLISKQWADMAEEKKAVYNDKSTKLKEKYSAEKAAYDENHPFETTAATTKHPKSNANPIKIHAEASSNLDSEVEAEVEGEIVASGTESSGEEEEEGSEEEDEKPPVKKTKRESTPPRERKRK